MGFSNMAMTNYFAGFPESLFPCVKNKQIYAQMINLGIKEARKSKLAIAFLARDIGDNFWNLYHRVCELGSYFNDFHVFAYENDSIDNTKELFIEWWNKDDRFTFKSEKLGKPKHGNTISAKRRVDMAYYRNQCYNLLHHKKCKWWADYIIILDSDVKGGFSYEGIMNSLGWMARGDADVMGSNGILYQDEVRLHYDYWAFRRYGEEKMLEPEEVNLMRFERGQTPAQVFSCFGGLAIYKHNALMEGAYYYTDKDCDHVTIHEQMRKDGTIIRLNPSQIVLYNETGYSV